MLDRLNSLAELFHFFNFWLSPFIHPCILICDDKSIKYWMKNLCQTQICEHTYTLLWVKKKTFTSRSISDPRLHWLICSTVSRQDMVDASVPAPYPMMPRTRCPGWNWNILNLRLPKNEMFKNKVYKNCKQSVIMNTARWISNMHS